MFSMRFQRDSQIRSTVDSPQWLKLIWAANSIDSEMFGNPVIVKNGQLPGDYAEEYEHTRVFFPADDPLTVRVSAKTERGSDVLTRAAARIKIEVAQ